jgi:hypothetical protein
MRTRMRTRMMSGGGDANRYRQYISVMESSADDFHLTLKRSRFQTILRTRIKRGA